MVQSSSGTERYYHSTQNSIKIIENILQIHVLNYFQTRLFFSTFFI